METLWARDALTDAGWRRDVRIDIDGTRIAAITPDAARAGETVDLLLPAPSNLHSHAFQRAMAGLAERRGTTGQDSFWTWRDTMYRFLEHLRPEDVAAIAAQAQVEMAEAGFAAVGEFHYLHHAPGGMRYTDLAEMAAQIAGAAGETGLGLTLLPVAYQQAGCDGRALQGGQLRFGTDPDEFARLVEASRSALGPLPPDTRLGVAPHSLRAVSPDGLAHAIGAVEADAPVHIHVAEQTAEVQEVTAHLGAPPVAWLLDQHDVGARWCLIHATHMTPSETRALAESGAVAGLCPETEANLGDGLFDAVGFREAGGHWGVGTDSNIRISLAGELRLLEYGQRLTRLARTLHAPSGGSAGVTLLEMAATGGAQALGRDAGAIRVGALADLVALDTTQPGFAGRSRDEAVDTFIFATPRDAVASVWSAGRRIVRSGRHPDRDRIAGRFTATLRRLGERL